MPKTRTIEIFSAGCPVCTDTVNRVHELAGSFSDVTVLDMKEAANAERARKLGVRAVPALAIDGKLASCCSGSGPDEAVWKGELA